MPQGVFRTSSSIYPIFVNLPMAKVRDFHCYSHVLENLEERSIPSDHAAVRLVIQRPNVQRHQGGRIPSCIFKHPVFCSILSGDHEYSQDPFTAFAEYKIILQKARKRTVRDFFKRTPESHGAKFLTASTALRAYGSRHLGTLMRCCETWEPVGKML